MSNHYLSDKDLEQLLECPPSIRDDGFTRLVDSRLEGKAATRRKVFAAAGLVWLIIFLADFPLREPTYYTGKLRLLGSRIENVIPDLFNIQPDTLLPGLASQPGILLGILILFSSAIALLSAQLLNR
ncbi:MAG: hypothetical protein R3F50_01200 [Gammaproteobacteria bacterium]|jgi:hypothetical protein